MTGANDFLINKMIDHVFQDTSYVKPTTLYIGLCTTTPAASDDGTGVASGSSYSPTPTGVEVTGGSYARVAYAPSSTAGWTATQGGVTAPSTGNTETTENSTAIIFPICSSSWGTVEGMFISDNDLTIQTGLTATLASATIATGTTTGFRVLDPIFVHDNSGHSLSTYVAGVTPATNVIMGAGRPHTTTAVATLIDGGHMLFFGDLTTPRSVATSDIFDFASNSLQVVLNCS